MIGWDSNKLAKDQDHHSFHIVCYCHKCQKPAPAPYRDPLWGQPSITGSQTPAEIALRAVVLAFIANKQPVALDWFEAIVRAVREAQ